MKIKKDILYKGFLIALFIVPVLFSSIEVTIAICAFMGLFLFLDLKFKFSGGFVYTILPLISVLAIATMVGFSNDSTTYDAFKDFVFLIKPILMLTLGYYLVGKIEDKEFIYRALVYVALVFAVYHLYRVGRYVSRFSFSIAGIRYVGGKANYIELIALVLLHVSKKRMPVKIPLRNNILVRGVLYASFFIYFSRTMFVAFLILWAAIHGYTKLTRKGIIYISLLLGILISSFTFLQTLDLDRRSVGFEGFLYKIQNAPAEIFTTKIDVSNHSDLWDHWRGYEANRAFLQLNKTDYHLGYVYGRGIGALVDLGFVAPLNADGIRYIPVLHNGFAYIIFKTGFLGLFCYLMFLAYLYFQAYHKQKGKNYNFLNNILSAFALYFFSTTLTITGIYNHGDVIIVAVGAFLYLRYYHKRKEKEV